MELGEWLGEMLYLCERLLEVRGLSEVLSLDERCCVRSCVKRLSQSSRSCVQYDN